MVSKSIDKDYENSEEYKRFEKILHSHKLYENYRNDMLRFLTPIYSYRDQMLSVDFSKDPIKWVWMRMKFRITLRYRVAEVLYIQERYANTIFYNKPDTHELIIQRLFMSDMVHFTVEHSIEAWAIFAHVIGLAVICYLANLWHRFVDSCIKDKYKDRKIQENQVAKL